MKFMTDSTSYLQLFGHFLVVTSVILENSIKVDQKVQEQQVLFFCGPCVKLLTPKTPYSWTIVQSMTKSLATLTYNTTSLKTLTRSFVKECEDIKC